MQLSSTNNSKFKNDAIPTIGHAFCRTFFLSNFRLTFSTKAPSLDFSLIHVSKITLIVLNEEYKRGLMDRKIFFKYSLYSLEIICPGRRGAILRLGAKSPLRPLVSSCFVLAAVLVSAEAVSDGSVSLETSGSSDISSWLVWAIGASVTLRRGNNGDLLDAKSTGVLVVVLGCTCSLFRLRNLFRGLTVVERAGGGLVSAGA